MIYKIVRNYRRNGNIDFTISKYWMGIYVGKIRTSIGVEIFETLKAAEHHLNLKQQERKANKQHRHDQEVRDSEVVSEWEIR
jgi:hypothetical protein